jgi:hypothetical protein
MGWPRITGASLPAAFCVWRIPYEGRDHNAVSSSDLFCTFDNVRREKGKAGIAGLNSSGEEATVFTES